MIPRAATPLTLLLLVAFGLQLVSVLSVPVVDKIVLANYQNVKFGVFGYCTNSSCSSVRVGYPDSIIDGSGTTDWSLPSGARQSLTNLLIVHPIAAGFTLILLVLALVAHFHQPANSPRYLLALLIFCLPTFILSLLAFLVDILLFVPHLAWGGWIVLGATVIIAIASLILCTMRRTLSSRKAMNKRIFDEDESAGAMRLNQMSFFPPGTANPDDGNADREVLIYDNEAKTSAIFESSTNDDEDDDEDDDDDADLDDEAASLNRRNNSATVGHAISDYESTPDTRAAPPPGQNRGPQQQRFDQYGRPLPQQEYNRYGPQQQRPYGRQPPQQGPDGAYDRRANGPYGQQPPNGYYPRDRLPRGQMPPYQQQRGGPRGRALTPGQEMGGGPRPPYAVVLPSASGSTPPQPMASYVTARDSLGSELESPSGIPVAGAEVGGGAVGEGVGASSALAGPTELPVAGTPVDNASARRGTDESQGEYVPPRQNWGEEDVAVVASAGAAGVAAGVAAEQEAAPRRRQNSTNYYDDVDPQYASEIHAGYTQTVSPVSLPSARSPYEEFRPPQGPNYFDSQQQQQQQQRRGQPRVAMGGAPPVSPGGGPQPQPYASRPMYPPEFAQPSSYVPAPPHSPDGSISSQFTSVSQRGVNPRYYTGGPTAPPKMQQSLQPLPPQTGGALTAAQQAKRDRTEMMLRANPDFTIEGIAPTRRGAARGIPQAATMGRAKDSPYAPAASRM
ncbi:SUR7/PalI family-domain-containing protein [Myxozyma melibiosi]|uniref:SUR7/PalI family-domain-containing protein n=1 Tax=Myxozyma melibiosi TaxID=54550 RepID=A0ABR1F2S9_9ASCO